MDLSVRFAAAAILLFAVAESTLAAQIDYFEPVTIDANSSATQFEAYGHRFQAQLENNDRLLTQLRAQKPSLSPTLRVIRGSLAGIPNSWVRLVENNGHVEGAFSDGDEYYAVTTYGQIAKLVSAPANIPSAQTVVFRLSDAHSLLPDNFCAVPASVGGRPTPYKRLVRELRAMSLPLKQLNISIIGDSALQTMYPSNATDVMIGIANIVDGIFADQVGVLIEPTDVRLVSASSDPFTGTNPDTLLTRLSSYRMSTPAVANQGLAYLVTGKDLDSDVVGIGYIGSLCDPAKSAALGEATFTPAIGALIAAHEFGHVFGAPHDAQSGSACAAEPPIYLMNPNLNQSSEFSQCSLSQIQPVVQAATCLTSGQWSDVAVEIGETNVPPENSVPFSFPITITSAGTLASQNVTFTGYVNPQWEMSAAVGSGNCTVQYANVSCTFGTLNAGETRQITITAVSHAAQTFTFDASVGADSDRLSHNSHASKQFTVSQTADAAISFSPTSLSAYADDPVQIAVKVASLLSKPVRDVIVTISSPLTLQSASVAGGSCSISGTSATCSIASIAAGSTAQIVLVATATSYVGTQNIYATFVASNDDNTSNNSANAMINVLPRRDVAINGQSNVPIVLVNEWQQVVVEVASIGVDPVDDVRYDFTLMGRGSELQSLIPDSGVCTGNEVFRSCSFGTMHPGDKHTIKIVARGTQPEAVELRSYVSASNDQQGNNNQITNNLDVRYEHEVSMASAFTTDGFETAPTQVHATIRSTGAVSAQNVVASLDVPAGVRIESAALTGASCTLAGATHIDCTLSSFATDSSMDFTATVTSDSPGTYPMHFSVNADGDNDHVNNSIDRDLLIRPFTDIGVKELEPITALVGANLTIPITIFTGPRPVASTTVSVQLPWFLSIQSVSPNVGTCSVAYFTSCTFTDLPANSEVQITVLAQANAQGEGTTRVDAYTPFDAALGNNSQTANATILSPSDATIIVGQENVNATVQTAFAYPQLTITGTAGMPEVNVEITIPDSITVIQASSPWGTCTIGRSVKCTLALVTTYSVPIYLGLTGSTVGTFSSTVSLSAFNDATPDNNTRTVTIVVAANDPPRTPPVSSPVTSGSHGSGGGGGGGSIDWLLSVLLAATLLLRRGTAGRRKSWR